MNFERINPPLVGDEREMLRAYLDYHRATLLLKCEALCDADLRRASVETSSLTLLGLVRHLAEVERAWFRRTLNAEDIPLVWSGEFDFQAAFDLSTATWEQTLSAWQDEIAHSRRIEKEATSLDVVAHQKRWDTDVSLRLVMLHMIHEYARHNGHADLLREAIDGTVGA